MPGASPKICTQGTMGVELEPYEQHARTRQRDSLLFVGNFHHFPNVDAVLFFYREIFPLILSQKPDVMLNIVGAELPDEIIRLQEHSNVVVTGDVKDIERYFGTHEILIAPIRIGSGVRVKILEAFAAGTPVVSTSIGAEGIDLQDGQEILLADCPADFSRCVLNLLGDRGLYHQLAKSAHRLIAEQYDYGAIAKRMTQEYRKLLTEKLEF